MKQIAAVTFVILTLALVVSSAATEKRYDLKLNAAVEANGVELKPGMYKISVEESSLVFYQGNKEVTKVPVQVEQSKTKNEQTSVHTIGDKLTEIWLSGTDMKLVIGGAQSRN